MNKTVYPAFVLFLLSNVIGAMKPTKDVQSTAAQSQSGATAAANSQQKTNQESTVKSTLPIPYYTIRNESCGPTHYELHNRFEKSKTFLMDVAGWGDLDSLKMMLESGADIAATDCYGQTAYDHSQSYHSFGLTDNEIQAKRDAMRELFLKYSAAQTYRRILPSAAERSKSQKSLKGIFKLKS